MTALPYEKLQQKQLNKCLTTMRRGNATLKKWAKFYGFRKGKEFRSMLLKGDRNPGGKIPEELLPQFHRELPLITCIHDTTMSDLDGKTVEVAMLHGFSNLIRKLARRWDRQAGNTTMSYDDFLQDASLALIDAIYGYTRDDVTFMTYAWAVLKNRLIYRSNKGNPLSPWTNEDRELLIRFEEARLDFNDRASFDQIAGHLGLSEDERNLLGRMMTKVICESQMEHGNSEQDDSKNDYTAFRNEFEQVDHNLVLSVRSAIDRAGLTEFERAVLETSAQPYYGWQTHVASQHTNPRTQKAYTRAGTAIALKNAQEKVRAILENEVDEEAA